jgi:hypothetical protein
MNSLAGSHIFLGWFAPGRYLWLGTSFPTPCCTISPLPPSPALQHSPSPAGALSNSLKYRMLPLRWQRAEHLLLPRAGVRDVAGRVTRKNYAIPKTCAYAALLQLLPTRGCVWMRVDASTPLKGPH